MGPGVPGGRRIPPETNWPAQALLLPKDLNHDECQRLKVIEKLLPDVINGALQTAVGQRKYISPVEVALGSSSCVSESDGVATSKVFDHQIDGVANRCPKLVRTKSIERELQAIMRQQQK